MSSDLASANENAEHDPFAPVAVDLKNPVLAAFLTWLIPGAGQYYQGRTGKAVLFFTCILSIYFLGLSMGGARVVYAKWDQTEKRLPMLCQVGVGLPSLPALAQALRVRNDMAPIEIGGVAFMAPPVSTEELGGLHRMYGFLFEIGTLYTMIAGLLNILAIYDAGMGPVWMVPESERKRRERLAKQEQEARKKAEEQGSELPQPNEAKS